VERQFARYFMALKAFFDQLLLPLAAKFKTIFAQIFAQ